MKNGKLIVTLALVILLGGLGIYFLSTGEKSGKTQSSSQSKKVDFKEVFSKRIEHILGFKTKYGAFEIDAKTNEFWIKNFDLILMSDEEPFLRIGEIKGKLPSSYQVSDEIILKEVKGTQIELPMLNNQKAWKLALSANMPKIAYRFYDVEAIKEISKSAYSKPLTKRFDKLKSLLNIYTMSKRDLSRCKKINSKRCQRIKRQKLKVTKQINDVLEDKRIIKLDDILGTESKLQIAELTKQNLFMALLKKRQEKVVDAVDTILRAMYSAQFLDKQDDTMPHLTIENFLFNEKATVVSEKELVGAIRNFSSLESRRDQKMVIRFQGDFDRYNLKGVNFRIASHKGKKAAVSTNSSIREMDLGHFDLMDDEGVLMAFKDIAGSARIKSFIHDGQGQGSINYEFLKGRILHNLIDKHPLMATVRGMEKEFPMTLSTSYQRGERGEFTDVVVESKKGKELSKKQLDSVKSAIVKTLEEELNKNEEMIATLKTFLTGYKKNLDKESDIVKSIWPEFKVPEITLDNQ